MIEGSPVEALVDTGSPVTIASIECLLDILEKHHQPGQSQADWMEQAKGQFHPPRISINSYGGGKVNIIAQFSTTLKHGDRQRQATILVQRGATLSLLLGTDVLPSLGFHLVKSPLHGQAIDILTKEPLDTGCSIGENIQDLEAAEWDRLVQIDISALNLEHMRASVNLIEVN